MVLCLTTYGAESFAFPVPSQSPYAAGNARSFKSRYAGDGANALGGSPYGSSSSLSSSMLRAVPRGGGSIVETLVSGVKVTNSADFFNVCLCCVVLAAAAAKFGLRDTAEASSSDGGKSEVLSTPLKPMYDKLRMKFLPTFYLLRLSDWLQGPYFYSVYATKTLASGAPYPLDLISKLFLTGFASTAVFGPYLGRLTDRSGRKLGTILFCATYAAAALSTKSTVLAVLFAGRVLSGLGTSLLHSAPEAWLVGESNEISGSLDADNGKEAGEELSKTFGLAYAGDSLVAIAAGQLASLAATSRGETGPFELSALTSVAGMLLVTTLWKENKTAGGGSGDVAGSGSERSGIREAVKTVFNDKRILMTGLIQAAFEGAMYTFVINWPPALEAAIASAFGSSATVPYGGIFSCFMSCCLLGSTLFQKFSKFSVSNVAVSMLSLATLSMVLASQAAKGLLAGATGYAGLYALSASFFAFEACVGVYFPLMGTIRSRTIPDDQRSLIMNLFGIPLNAIVVAVFLGIKRLGVDGALGVSAGALAIATAAAITLKSVLDKEK